MALKPSLRFEIFKRDAFTCRYCGRKSPEAILEIDHILPKSADGSDEPENLVTACYECNRGKGARLLTNIPPEENLHEKTISIAEQELQLAEYNHWRAKQRAREDKEITLLEGKWQADWGGKYWNKSDARKFLRHLGYDELLDVLELVKDKTELSNGSWAYSAWRFFCGICHRRIKDQNDAQD